jgi:hypothetical protein
MKTPKLPTSTDAKFPGVTAHARLFEFDPALYQKIFAALDAPTPSIFVLAAIMGHAFAKGLATPRKNESVSDSKPMKVYDFRHAAVIDERNLRLTIFIDNSGNKPMLLRELENLTLVLMPLSGTITKSKNRTHIISFDPGALDCGQVTQLIKTMMSRAPLLHPPPAPTQLAPMESEMNIIHKLLWEEPLQLLSVKLFKYMDAHHPLTRQLDLPDLSDLSASLIEATQSFSA